MNRDSAALDVSSARTLDLRRLPASRLGFIALAVMILLHACLIDRASLLDQDNYIANFAEAVELRWIRDIFGAESLVQGLILAFFSEELGWRCWATVVGWLIEPEAAVRVTAVLTNLLVIAAVARLPRPFFALLSWAVLPVGLAVTGVVQLRQGFALGIFLWFSLRSEKPLLGALVAATVHTTFAVALAFIVMLRVIGHRQRLGLVGAILAALLAAQVGALLFEAFGGRRLAVYSVDDGATSLNYAIAAFICTLPGVALLLFARADRRPPGSRVMEAIAIAQVGATFFVIFSVFLFPLGAGRAGYLTLLFLIPLLGWIDLRRPEAAFPVGLACSYLLYMIAKTYMEGTYRPLVGT